MKKKGYGFWGLAFMLLFLFLGLGFCDGKPPQQSSDNTNAEAQQQTNEESKVIKVGAIFSITGPTSFLGVPEKESLEMLAEEINSQGGINGAKIELVIKDSQGRTDITLASFKELVAQNVIAIIGPSVTANTMTIKEHADKNKMLVISCASSEDIVNPVAQWVFKVAPKDAHAAVRIYEECQKRNITKVGILSVQTGFGQGGRNHLLAEASKYNIQVVADEVYPKDANDLTAQLARIKDTDAQAVINWSVEPVQGKVIVNMAVLKMNIPLFQSHGFANEEYAAMAGDTEGLILFPASRILAPDNLPSGPLKDICVKYRDQYVKKFQKSVSTFGGHAYDSLMILADAIKTVGQDKEAIRTHIENLKNFPGTAGWFNFSPEDHNGLTKDCFQLFTVKNGRFDPVNE